MAHASIPHFANDKGVATIHIGVKEFNCMGARAPFDHPHIFLDMGSDDEIICPYCSTLYKYDAKLHADETVSSRCACGARGQGCVRSTERRSLIIAGGGIGGLTAALTAAEAGLDVTVLEAAPAIEEIGAGVQLTPNVTHILKALGVDAFLSPQAVSPEALDIRRGESGKTILSVPLGKAVMADYGAPWWVVHRADLQAALLARIAQTTGITIQTGKRLEDITSHDDGITLRTSHRGQTQEHRATALIGADGLWSRTRQCLGDTTPPLPARRIALRATVAMEQVPDCFRRLRSGLWMGAKAHLVHYPVRGGSLLNLVAVIADGRSLEGWNNEASRTEVLAAFMPWCAEARQLLAVAPHWKAWPLMERPVFYGSGSGPVTLLGDAAHPMMPFMAQGAAMAIEDAAILGRELKASPDDVAGALRRYEAARKSRVSRVQRNARINGGLYHLSGLAADLRDLGMKTLGGAAMLKRTDWLYRWRL